MPLLTRGDDDERNVGAAGRSALAEAAKRGRCGDEHGFADGAAAVDIRETIRWRGHEKAAAGVDGAAEAIVGLSDYFSLLAARARRRTWARLATG